MKRKKVKRMMKVEMLSQRMKGSTVTMGTMIRFL